MTEGKGPAWEGGRYQGEKLPRVFNFQFSDC